MHFSFLHIIIIILNTLQVSREKKKLGCYMQ